MVSNRAIVNCAKEFVGAFNDGHSSIGVYEMTSHEIDKIRKELNLDEIFNSALAVKNIRSYHQLQWINEKAVGFVISADSH